MKERGTTKKRGGGGGGGGGAKTKIETKKNREQQSLEHYLMRTQVHLPVASAC
jgi:hypothetical protein